MAHEVETGRFRTAADIRRWVAQTFGVSYTGGGMYGLLARLRWGPTVPRPVHVKADLQEQEAWKGGARGPARGGRHRGGAGGRRGG
ncbi:MAG: winged helix-turn-helix domain-containing protein [Chloroflexi bacterium]|nr:winged helix-turn-helix domain-containing protein [Chloroflexota bacterium]